ncbi:hypothetical protein BKA82DRAFT_4011406 [Pisolithus tinctorius]|nr:hypothetical protein BKA82DRAFT_4011406 [Pisolithus tinctorius]
MCWNGIWSRNLFDKLTNIVNSGTCNLGLLGSNSPLWLPMTTGKKPPMCKTHPKVQFWTRKDYKDWLDSPEAGGSNCGLYAYLEDENGDVPTSEMLTKIQRALCAERLPLFKLVESGWKLEHLCTKTYLAWRTKHLDDHGNFKRTTCDMIKGEALNDDDDLKSLNPSSKKCKGPADASLMLSNKKQKYCFSTINPQDMGTALANKENNPSIDNANIPTAAKNPIVYNPLSLLAMAVGKVNVLPVPPNVESPQLDEQSPSDSTFTNASKDCKTSNYNNEAKELVVKNTWTKSVIEQDNIVQTTMDSGMCHLCIDTAGASIVAAISYEFI